MLLVYFYSFSALFRNLQHERGDSFRLTCSMLFVHKIIFIHTIFWFYGERALMKWKHAQKVLSLWCTKRWWCSVRFSVCVCVVVVYTQLNLLQQVVYLKYTFTLLHAIYLNYVLIIHHLYVHVPCDSPWKMKTINSGWATTSSFGVWECTWREEI